MRPVFKDFYDSGFPEKWFSLAGNTLITAGAMVVWSEGSFFAGILSVISYICLVTQTTHGTRNPYEYLKEIYVYPKPDRWYQGVFLSVFFVIRWHFILAPFLLVWWAYSTGKVPF
jgi:hypothetical protein